MTEIVFPASALAGRDAAAILKYRSRVEDDFAAMRPWLPAKVDGVLDIGCGLAAIDVLLGRALTPSIIYLIDGDGRHNRKAVYTDEMGAWSDVEIGAELVRANLPDTEVVTWVPEPGGLLPAMPVDLIVSLKSWCHHYPAHFYDDLAHRSLRPGGRVVLDIRTGSGNRAALESRGLKVIAEIGGSAKRTRVVMAPVVECCEKCETSAAEELHACPYAEELAGDSETLCNCCSGCERGCAMDI